MNQTRCKTLTRTAALFAMLISGLHAQNRTLNGTVKNQSGAAVSGAAAKLQPGDLQATANAAGAFSFPNLAPGSYQLTVTSSGYVPFQAAVAVRDAPVKVEVRLGIVQSSVEVHGTVEDLLIPAASSVTKSSQQLMDLPFSVQIIPQAIIQDRQDVKDVYRNISGVTDGAYNAMTFRGFMQSEVLYNGVKGNPYGSLAGDVNNAGFSTTKARLTNIESVEVLKGPAAVLFGAGEPGGVVSYVTKKPRETPSLGLAFRTGNFQQKGGEADLTGPLWKRKTCSTGQLGIRKTAKLSATTLGTRIGT